jgi:hypothetical protein
MQSSDSESEETVDLTVVLLVEPPVLLCEVNQRIIIDLISDSEEERELSESDNPFSSDEEEECSSVSGSESESESEDPDSEDLAFIDDSELTCDDLDDDYQDQSDSSSDSST